MEISVSARIWDTFCSTLWAFLALQSIPQVVPLVYWIYAFGADDSSASVSIYKTCISTWLCICLDRLDYMTLEYIRLDDIDWIRSD